MKKYSLLIVEDESIVGIEIKNYVKKLGYDVLGVCTNADDALALVREKRVDIVLMDICIKGVLDGIEASVLIKANYPDIEIIFLTAHLDDYNVDRAIKVNPIAYLAKPFRREELRVFLKIAIQKISKNHMGTDGSVKYLMLDSEFSYALQDHALYCYHEIIHLTKKESELLDILVQNRNCIVDFYTIENLLWPDKIANKNTIRTLVTRLRQKLKHKFIEAVPSQGYRFIV
ncbi:MAG TPA: response regulator transcription factor [Sulfurovum sp.]|nr:response regulator transcription factor [Sulfurovum sp.]